VPDTPANIPWKFLSDNAVQNGERDRDVTSNETPGKLATAATAFMAHIGSDVMIMLSMPAGQKKQRRETRSHVTSR